MYTDNLPSPNYEEGNNARWTPVLGIALNATRGDQFVELDTGDGTYTKLDANEVERLINALRAASLYAQ